MYLLEKNFNDVLITFLKRLKKFKQVAAENETGMAEKSCWDQADRQQNLVWLGEIEIKLAKLSKTTFT
jgi:hypothetical protein